MNLIDQFYDPDLTHTSPEAWHLPRWLRRWFSRDPQPEVETSRTMEDVTLADAQGIALVTGRSYATIRTWILRGKLVAAGTDQHGRKLYDAEQAEQLAAMLDQHGSTVQHSDRSRTTAS